MGLVDNGAALGDGARHRATPARWSIDRDDLMKLMRREPVLAVKLLWSFVQVLSDRLRNTNDALTSLNRELDSIRAKATDPLLESVEPKKSGPPPFGQ